MSKLILLREKLCLTQEELSDRSGISVRTIQRIEAGNLPKGYTLRALAKALEVNENELLSKNEIYDDVDITWFKLINLSSLPFTIIPPANILLPVILMFAKKKFNPLVKQLVSIQIIWFILSTITFLFCSFIKVWFNFGSKFLLIIVIVLMITNVFIIIKNAASLDKSGRLYFKLGFSMI